MVNSLQGLATPALSGVSVHSRAELTLLCRNHCTVSLNYCVVTGSVYCCLYSTACIVVYHTSLHAMVHMSEDQMLDGGM